MSLLDEIVDGVEADLVSASMPGGAFGDLQDAADFEKTIRLLSTTLDADRREISKEHDKQLPMPRRFEGRVGRLYDRTFR